MRWVITGWRRQPYGVHGRGIRVQQPWNPAEANALPCASATCTSHTPRVLANRRYTAVLALVFALRGLLTQLVDSAPPGYSEHMTALSAACSPYTTPV